MMARKDFERIAQVFRVNRPDIDAADLDVWEAAQDLRSDLIDDMCVELKAINPRFDEDKFRKACDAGGN